MSVKKLLCGAALASLIAAPAASALDLVKASTVTVAEELDFADGNVGGAVSGITISTTAALPVNNGYKLTINLTGDAGFDTFTAAALSAVTPADVSGQIVSSGGADGSQTVTVLFDVDDTDVGPVANALTLALPIDVNGCGSSVGLDIVLTDPNDNPIEGGAASLIDAVGGDPLNLVECVPAFEVTFTPDDADGDPDAQTLLELDDDFSTFVNDGDDNVGEAFIADLVVDLNPTAGVTAVGDDLATAIVIGDVDGIDFVLNLPDTTGIANAQVVGAASADATVLTTAAVDGAYTFALGTIAEGTSILELNLTTSDGSGDQIAPQQPTISGLVLDLDDGENLADQSLTGSTDSLDLEGESFGPFDWVGDAAKGTANIFRVTGMSATPPEAAVTVVNSSEGVNGTWTMTLDAANVSNGEYLIRASDIEAATGAPYGRGDVTFTFFTSDTLDVDRLISTGGIVTAYGNTANNDD